MTKLDEAVEKLKALLFKAEQPIEVIEQKFTDQKLEDGVSIISYDAEELAVGVIVYLLDEAGQRLPLPVGDYVTENGDTFTVVDETGVIDNVVLAPEVEETEEVAAPAVAAPMAQAEAPKAAPKRVIKSQVEEHVFNAFKDEILAEVEKLKSENIELKKQIEKSTSVNKEMFNVVSQIADAPAAKPTETKEKFSVAKYKEDYKQSMRELEEKIAKENNY